MNRRYSAIGVSALALGAAALTATEASARLEPDPADRYTTPQCNYPYHPVCELVPEVGLFEAAPIQSPSDGEGAEALRMGASALGGAGLAFGGLWLYRRRHLSAV